MPFGEMRARARRGLYQSLLRMGPEGLLPATEPEPAVLSLPAKQLRFAATPFRRLNRLRPAQTNQVWGIPPWRLGLARLARPFCARCPAGSPA